MSPLHSHASAAFSNDDDSDVSNFAPGYEAIAYKMLAQLSYVQVQHDYILGNYPVGRDDAAQLSALQILVEIGFVGSLESCTDWNSLLERFLPTQIGITRAKREWEMDICSRYSSLEHLTKDDGRQQFLRILRTLPYASSAFFRVRMFDGPIGLLPRQIVLGINERGVHFFRPVPKEYLHSAELRDIMQFGSGNTGVFFKMRVAGVLHIFQFETKQGEEICIALQTHINDVMLRRYSKAQSSSGNSINGDVSSTFKPPSIEVYEKHVQDLSKVVEESQKYTNQLLEEAREKQQQEVELKEELENLKVTLRSEKQNWADAESYIDKLKSLCNEKDEALQDAIREKKSIEVKLDNLALENNAKKDHVGTNNQVLTKLQNDLRIRNEELHAAEEATKRLINEKSSLEQRIAKLEKEKVHVLMSLILLSRTLGKSTEDGSPASDNNGEKSFRGDREVS